MPEINNEFKDNEEVEEDKDAKEKEITIDTVKMARLMQKKRDNQSIIGAIFGGIVASLIGAGIWAGITVAAEYQIGWMAIGVGFLVGFSIRFLGKGYDTIFGILGAIFSLFGCLLGNFLTIVIFASIQENIPFLQIITDINFGLVVDLMTETFRAMDLLFYGIAIYEGFRFSINRLSEDIT